MENWENFVIEWKLQVSNQTLFVYKKPGLIPTKTQMIVFPSQVIHYIEKIAKSESMEE
jgi:hypothetical protein